MRWQEKSVLFKAREVVMLNQDHVGFQFAILNGDGWASPENPLAGKCVYFFPSAVEEILVSQLRSMVLYVERKRKGS